MKRVVGVLGLQGDFALHQKCITRIRATPRVVRWPDELTECEGLVIPGGESTTFIKLLEKSNLFEAVKEFAKERPVMGTCAGLIILAKRLVNDDMKTLGLIDIEVERNSYGRQVDSFNDKVRIKIFKDNPEFEGVFIRAPRIISLGRDVEPLAFHENDVVMAKSNNILVLTFHPELTKDLRIHRYFVEKMIGS